MKVDRNVLFEMIAEAMEAPNFEFGSFKELEEVIHSQITEGVRKFKTGEGNFDLTEFRNISKKIQSIVQSKGYVWSSGKYGSEEGAQIRAKKDLVENGTWGLVPDLYHWSVSRDFNERHYTGYWVPNRKVASLKDLTKKWLEIFEPHWEKLSPTAPSFSISEAIMSDGELDKLEAACDGGDKEACAKVEEYYVEKMAGLVSAAPDRAHINSAIQNFEMISFSWEPKNVLKLSVLFLDKIFDLYSGLSYGGGNAKAAEQEEKEIDVLRDQFLEIYREHSGGAKLPPEQFEKYAKSIVITSGNPGKDLFELGYDFHSVFEKAFGFPPPRSKAFEMSENGEELTLKVTVYGKDMEFEFWYDMQHPDNLIMDPWVHFETMHGADGSVETGQHGGISFDEGQSTSIMKDEPEITKEQLPSALRSAMGIPWDANLPEWPELPKGQPPVDGPEGTDEPVYEGKKKLNKSYLMETIAEVMSETEENFGGSPDGDLLHEAWDSQWPPHFSELKTVIQDFTHKEQKTPKEILAKYAIEAMSFKFLKPAAAEFDDDNWGIWDAYERVFKDFKNMYVRDEGDEAKIEKLMSRVFNNQTKTNWVQKFFDVRRDKGNEAALRVLNKMISSLDKQIFGKPEKEGGIAGIFGELKDKGVDWKNVSEQFAKEITGVIQGMQFKEGSLAQSKIYKIIRFVNLDKSDDNAKKLEAYYDNIKAAANSDEIDVLAIANNLQIIQITNSWIEEQLHTIDMTPCPDSEVDKPCVMHNFDDGFFWYDINADTCELTAQKMNSCGETSMSGSELFNLMSHSETGKPRWHVTVEWNEEEKAFIQVLGNANTVPKKEYWPHIKWLYEKYGKPEISGYAWEHVRGDNVKQNVYEFLKYLGLKSDEPLTEEWVQMKQQIDDGFYNVYSFEGDRAPEGDFSRLRFFAHANRIEMSMRIKRKLLTVGSAPGASTYDDIQDYKNAARRLHRTEVLADDYVLDMIPSEWNEFFNAEGLNQRVRFSHGGNMMLHFNWTSIPLQEMTGGRHDDPEYRNQLQREGLAFFMTEMKQNFSVEAMTQLGKDVGNQLEDVADEILMSRPAQNLDEGKKKTKLDRNYLSSMILEVLDESQWYYDALDIDTEKANTVIHLGQSLSADSDRDRATQIDKYVSLKIKKVIGYVIKNQTMAAIQDLTNEAIYQEEERKNVRYDGKEFPKRFDELKSLYEGAMREPLRTMRQFDGTQESLNKWLDAMESVENNLKAAEPIDPAIKVMETIIPKYFLISDYYSKGEVDEWGEDMERKVVKPRTAVKEAEEFFRPALMKTIMGIQKRMVGDAELDRAKTVFGLDENEENEEFLETIKKLLLMGDDYISQAISLYINVFLGDEVEQSSTDDGGINRFEGEEYERTWRFFLDSRENVRELHEFLLGVWGEGDERDYFVSTGAPNDPPHVEINYRND